jgi:AcrR family transcriptional regulator
VYQYFPDKRAIYLALHDRHAALAQRALQTCVDEHESAALGQLVPALLDALVDAHAEDPELYQLLLSEVPHGAAGTRALEQQLRAALRPAVLAAAPAKTPRELDRTLFLLTQLLDGLAHAAVLRRPPQLSLAAAKAEAVRAILAYVRS